MAPIRCQSQSPVVFPNRYIVGLLRVPPVSLVLATAQPAYVRGLTTFRAYDDGSVASWVGVFSQAMRSAATHAVALASDLAKLEADWRSRGQVRRRGATPDRLISALAASPVIDIPRAATTLGVEYETARQAVERLVGVGILTPTSARRRDRTFEARDMFDLIDGFERSIATPPGASRPVRPAPARRPSSP